MMPNFMSLLKLKRLRVIVLAVASLATVYIVVCSNASTFQYQVAAAESSGTKVYDKSGNYLGNSSNGRVYDRYGNFQGENRDGSSYDRYGNYQGRTDGEKIYDKSGNYKGKVNSDGSVHDKSGNFTGKIQKK